MPVTIVYEWDGECLRPTRGYEREADRRFVIGERYLMDEYEERSWESHRHYFACIKKAFENLPEGEKLKFSNPDELRKHALIMSGWHVSKQIPLPSEELAIAVMNGLNKGFKDEYSIVTITAPERPGELWVVTQLWAKTQTNRGPLRLNHRDFQQSKDDVFSWLADFIGVPLEELSRVEHKPKQVRDDKPKLLEHRRVA